MFRLLLLKLVRRLFLRRDAQGDPRAARRVLLIRADERMGNLILTTPLALALRRLLPQTEIDWLVAARFAPLVADNPHRIRVLPFGKRWLFHHPLRWLLFLLSLRRRCYDLVIDASAEHAFSLTGMLLTLWSGAPLRIGHARSCFDEGYTHAAPPSGDGAHEIERKLKLTAVLMEILPPRRGESEGGPLDPSLTLPGAGRESTTPWIAPPPPEVGRKIEEWLNANCLKGKLLFLWPGARKADRRWPMAGYARLLESAKISEGWKVIIGWGPGEEAEAEALARMTGGRLAPRTNPVELAALLGHMTAVVTNDTGPMHLAYALGRPVFSILPDEVALRFGYRGGKCRAFVAGSQGPLHLEAARELRNWLEEIMDRAGHEHGINP